MTDRTWNKDIEKAPKDHKLELVITGWIQDGYIEMDETSQTIPFFAVDRWRVAGAHTVKQEPEQVSGCRSHGCLLEKPEGQSTNGPCGCLEDIQPLTLRNEIHRKLRKLQQLEAKRESPWRPIAEAPRDGTPIGAYVERNGKRVFATMIPGHCFYSLKTLHKGLWLAVTPGYTSSHTDEEIGLFVLIPDMPEVPK